ncbi:phytosulfokine receptor 1-like [Canna indica]|uniref:Phytosulfokine receptor 1-like n=1 Tax=Canna indica TaxID=4628 RepID=A0AAQ3QFB4_9LILI|nr:phytosulfokine receptor 1-like [Canna indica]
MKDIILMGASPLSANSCCILSLLFLFFLKIDASACSSSDLIALQDFWESLETKILEWPLPDANSSSCCSWLGIQCDFLSGSPSAVRVVGLNLSGKSLQGVLPNSISGLDKLRFLNLSNNYFRGHIPPELFYLKFLEVLDLSKNQLSGTLPQLGMGNLSSLRHLDLSNNKLTGAIPDTFQSMRELEIFLAESNAFVGELPASLSSCSKLTFLSLWNNSLEGSIGNIDFRGLVSISSLNLGWNKFQGHIPEVLSGCKELKILSLPCNNLSGQIPKSLCNHGALRFLDLHANILSNISASLDGLQNCQNLTTLFLTWNFKGEHLPINGIRGFPNLWGLDIGFCGLRGYFPSWLRHSRDLRTLAMSSNYLTGEIPSWLGGLDHLITLDLSDNLLSGEIPVSLSQLKSLRSGVSKKDTYLCCVPQSVYWGKGDQIISGSTFKLYINVPIKINLSHNILGGPIWSEFGHLKYIHNLDLSWNNLSGSIPEELSGMVNLEKLDLSFNNLSGSIPSSLTGLTFLSSFNVAYNHLQGLIPSGAQFFSFPCSSFEGNPGLYSNSPHSCNSIQEKTKLKDDGLNDEEVEFTILGLPFAIGATMGFLFTVYLSMCCWGQNYDYE